MRALRAIPPACMIFLIVSVPAYAQDTATNLLNLSSVWDFVINTAVAAILAAGTWGISTVAAVLKKKTGIDIDAQYQAMLHDAMERGVHYAAAKMQELSGKYTQVEVDNAIVRMAAEYVISKMPETIAHFGLTTQGVQDLVTAKLATIKVT